MTDGTPIAQAGSEFLLRPGIAFLNHGSFGACPRPIFAEYQRWQRALEEQPVEFLARRLDDLLAEARGELGTFLGTSGDNLVFVPNATYGMNIVAHSFPLEPGDEVLGTTHEYGAVERTWTFICEAKGARYRSQPITLPATSAEAIVEQLWQGVTPRTRALVISHITSPTALIFPVAEICRRAAAEGIVTIIDGAHAPGQIDLTLDSIGADFYTGNLHKWTCAPKGSAFLYARPDRQPMLQPLVVSWGWRAIEPGPSLFQDYFGWTGTHDPAAYLSVAAAVAFQRQHDWPSIRAACHELASQASQRIGALTGLPPISPETPDWWGQMRAIPIPRTPVSAKEIQRRLWDEFQVEIPLTEWQDQRFVRVSIQAYNTQRDVDRLVAALSAVLDG
ncbi:MAG TPA: aminotransferase class V-fold PLP-dependent enzyme [Ktedonobacterales bacterium]|nr:aminotransferase class V-fold PLP-dependent enzyme [Ktedonobacterales bacterium]